MCSFEYQFLGRFQASPCSFSASRLSLSSLIAFFQRGFSSSLIDSTSKALASRRSSKVFKSFLSAKNFLVRSFYSSGILCSTACSLVFFLRSLIAEIELQSLFSSFLFFAFDNSAFLAIFYSRYHQILSINSVFFFIERRFYLTRSSGRVSTISSSATNA